MVRHLRSLAATFAVIYLLCVASSVMAQQFPESTYQELRWRMIGPYRGGRTRALAGVPSQPNVFYIGVVNGGVWKSTDYGRTWLPIFDSQPTQSIGAIAIAPSDPNIIYVASGEGLARPDLSVGNGIYKSTDAGKTWTHLGLRNGQQIPGLAIDARDPNHVLAAVLGHPYGQSEERGIYLSSDGGQNWTKVLSKNENTGGDQVEFDPANPDVAYASMWSVRQGPWEDNNEYQTTDGGLFKSTDGGKTWHPLTSGLPNNVIQIHFAIAQSQTSRLYAVAGTQEAGEYGSGKGLGIYRSDDSGETWTRATDDGRPAMRIGGGDLPMLGVDAKNPDVVYSASIVTVRSTDGGKTWTSIRGAPGGDDYQNIWINPRDPKIILIVSDQGAIVSVNGGETWSSWYNQPTAQMYHVSVSNEFPYKVCGGQQESGSVCTLSRGNDGEITFRDWHPVGAIEYGYVAPDPLNPDIIYGAGRNEVSKYHWSTGQVQNVSPIPLRDPKFRTDRTQPIMFSPIDPHVLYTAANFLFKSSDGGNHWDTISPDLAREHPGIPPSVDAMVKADPKNVAKADKQRGVIYALAPSFRTEDVLWAGTDDGYIWNTRDGGKNWNNITPPELTPWSKVTQISASHFDDESAYASVSRFRIDDLKPYIYRTHDGGKTWQLIIAGLPDNAPVDTVREDPVRKGLLFAGTETSVWVSFDDGDHWQSLQLNLPHTSVRDLWIYEDDLILATHGRSFWILDDISPLRQLSESLTHASSALFKPAPAFRVRRSTYTDTPIPPDEPAGENPPNGAIIDYALAQRASSPVTLEIHDSQGTLVRKFSSDDKPDQTEEEIAKQLIPLYWIRPQKILSADAGMHRWVWDLHYPAPVALRHEYPISAVPHDTPRHPLGPRALPGNYTVKFSAGDASFSEPLTVRMDPRVKTSQEGLRALFAMQKTLADRMTRSSEAVTQARAIREQLEKLSPRATGSTKDGIEALDKKLGALLETPAPAPVLEEPPAPVAAPVPPVPAESTLTQVATNVAALYAQIDRADLAPTPAQDQALVTIERDFVSAIKHWEALRSSDIPSLNRQLKRGGLAELTANSNRKTEEESGGDEE